MHLHGVPPDGYVGPQPCVAERPDLLVSDWATNEVLSLVLARCVGVFQNEVGCCADVLVFRKDFDVRLWLAHA